MSVPRSPRISLFANMLTWISICVPLSEHVHACVLVVNFFYLLTCSLFMYISVTVSAVLTWKNYPKKIVCIALARVPVFILYVSSMCIQSCKSCMLQTLNHQVKIITMCDDKGQF